MTVKTVSRNFTTVVELDNVRLRVPDSFKSECKVPATNITVDAQVVPDTRHYYSGVPLAGGVYLNRHYYFPTVVVPLGKSVVARVRVETETFPDGREFTMMRIFVYAEPRRAEYELKLRQGGDVCNLHNQVQGGIPIKGTQAKIVFEKIEHKTAEAAQVVAA